MRNRLAFTLTLAIPLTTVLFWGCTPETNQSVDNKTVVQEEVDDDAQIGVIQQVLEIGGAMPRPEAAYLGIYRDGMVEMRDEEEATRLVAVLVQKAQSSPRLENALLLAKACHIRIFAGNRFTFVIPLPPDPPDYPSTITVDANASAEDIAAYLLGD